MKSLRFRFLGALVSTACLGILSTPSADDVVWEDFSRWTVSVNSDFGYGCTIESKAYDPMLFAGFDNSDVTAFVAFANEKWRSIEEGKRYELEMDFDGNEFWGDTFVGMKDPDDRGILVLWGEGGSDSSIYDWLRDFASHHELTIRFEGKTVGTIPLRGTAEAVRSLLECHEATTDLLQPEPDSEDPFSDPTPNDDDPFA